MSLLLLAPPGEDGTPLTINVVTGGPPEQERPLAALAHWHRAISLSWMRERPLDWIDLLDAINGLQASPYAGTPASHTNVVQVEGGEAMLNSRQLPNLGVTVFVLHGLGQTITAVMPDKVPAPKNVRLIPVEG